MDKNLKAVFELSRIPMLAVTDGRISHANSFAVQLFGSSLVGSAAVGIIPDHILANPSDSFVASARIDSASYSASVARVSGTMYISLSPEKSKLRPSELLSDSLMNSMLSTLFNIGLAIDRVSAETGEKSGKLEEYLAILNHSYFNMRHSLSNLSTALALKRDEMPFSFRAVDLARLCSELVSTVSVMSSGKGIELSFSTQHGELFAWADAEKVERIILNIISNSLAHTPRGGKISIGLEASGDTAYISVDDNGRGIPAAEMGNLFSKYENELDAGSLSSVSTGGLGLGIARGLAEAHGGALIIESREGKGTSVRIMLPLRSSCFNTLESRTKDYVNSGMTLILTEMATVLDSDSYTNKYLD